MPHYRTTRSIHTPIHSHETPFVFTQRSIACERHPKRNEDSFVVDEQSGLAAVFDGVGGSAAGEIASQIAAHATLQGWHQVLDRLQRGRRVYSYLECSSSFSIDTVLQQLILTADELVRTEGAKRAGTDDLATTAVLAVFCRHLATRNYKMVYAHVGDSRIYLFNKREGLKRLTNDDGLLAKLVEKQVVNDEEAMRIDQAMYVDELNDSAFSYFRLRGGITQALGGPFPPTIHTGEIAITPGDRILLCTDGIHDNLTDKEICCTLSSSPRVSAARLLVERSLQRSRQERDTSLRAKPDDMTAVVLTCRFC
ncbi:MAG: serine/threonine-protein phosphatase [Chloroflexi bacterium]|nr:serine/threonine-protein phosphatase [Ktedonobacteraceae bacterium]MBV9021413.1 serine/threonine-protein phosphatase [Ktedonobacteraceae bacterium]MBV9708668.1 serine/threonine-protein phosphatase [Chloroflexota bacterium]